MSRWAQFTAGIGNKISSKLLLVVGTLLLPVAVLSYLLYANADEQVVFARDEQVGAEYLTVTRQAVATAVEHRALTAEYLTGQADSRAAADKKQAEVEELFKKIDDIERRMVAQNKEPLTKKAIDRATTQWRELLAKLNGAKPRNTEKAYETLVAYDKFIESLRDLMVKAADGSRLTFDPEAASYALMASEQRITSDMDLTGRARWRALLATQAPDKTLTLDQKADLLTLLGELRYNESDIDFLLSDTLEARRDYDVAISPKLKNWKEKRQNFLARVDQDVARTEKVTLTADKVTEAGTATLGATTDLFDAAAPLLSKELTARADRYNRTLYLGAVALFVGLAIALGVVYFVTRSFTQQIREYIRLFTAVNHGDYSARVETISADELGDMAGSLNQMVAHTDELIQKQKDEYDDLQRSIMKLLDDVSGTAGGDLTKQAEVTADATGAIADSFNYMIDQLRKIIGNVQTATLQVSSAATQIHISAEQLAEGSEAQVRQIVTTSAAIDEMAVSIQQVSDNAATSSTVAQQALTSAKQGNTAVRNTIDGMGRIREQAQETAKRIKRLGETTQEIGQIVQLIDDIADRTSILALNASIQAAAAGEAGRGFAVVAEEVERLAVRSTEATKKIAGLVKAIQSETNEAVSAMEKNIQEVVSGSKVANQAGQALQEIEGVSVKLSELIQQISQASKQQARGSESLAKSMSEISQVTRHTASGTKQAAESVSSLAGLADELRSSVSAFRLPAGYVDAAALMAPSHQGHGGRRNGRSLAL